MRPRPTLILVAQLLCASAAIAADVDESSTSLKADESSTDTKPAESGTGLKADESSTDTKPAESGTGLKADDTSTGLKLYGSVSLGLFGAATTARDAAKANEYRDLDNGVLAGFDIKGRGSKDYIDAYAENIARTDQYIYIKGGRYESLKYQLYWNDIPHNLAFGARTPYTGAGSNTSAGSNSLTAIFPSVAGFSGIGQTSPLAGGSQAPPAWNTFNFGYQRNDIGGMFEFSGGSPFYIRVDANQVTQEGTKLIAGASGTSPGNGFIDKPFPVDFKTYNFSLEGGYAVKQGQISVNLLHSEFNNENTLLRWTNPFFASGVDTSTLPPDSQLNKISINGNLRGLPVESTLAGRLTYSQTTNNVPVLTSALNLGGAISPTNPSETSYSGDIVYETASLSLFSNWTKAIDTKLYWNYIKKENNGGEVSFTNLPVGLTCGQQLLNGVVVNPGDCTTEVLDYDTNDLGIDAAFRLNPTNRLILGYEFVDTHQTRVDYDETITQKASIEWRNTSLESLSSRLKFQYLNRNSNFLLGSAGVNANDPDYLNRFIQRYDLANANQSLIKLGLDWDPAPLWTVGFEGIWSRTDYDKTVLGRTSYDRQQYYFSVAWGDMAKFRVMAFLDLEYLQYDSFHRNISTVSNGTAVGANAGRQSGWCLTTFNNCFDPNTPNNASNYNWGGPSQDNNQSIGLGVTWLPMERLKLNGSAIYMKTYGNSTFTTPLPSQVAVPIYNSDNTTKFSLYLRGTYALTPKWDISAGYSFERYRFNDIAYNGYQYLIAGAAGPNFNSTSTSYLSGIYAFPDYTVNMGYIVATYKF